MSNKELDDYRSYAKKRQERVKTDKFKLMPGPNTIRILKTPKGAKSTPVLFEFAMHNEVGPEKAWLRCGIDPITGKGKCFICQKLIPKLEKSGKESRAAKLAPETKLVVQVASISEDGKWSGPHLFYPSGKKADEITALLTSKRRDYVDPRRGYNIGINRTGTGKTDTRYGPLEPDAESSKVPSKIMDVLKPFDELKQIAKYDEDKQKKAYYGEDGPDEDEDDDRKSKKRGRDDDEDEEDYDEDVDDDEDDDDEDEKPKSKKGKKSSKKKLKKDDDDDDDEDDEDDDDEDDEDDDDEEEKPRKKKKKSRR